LVVCGVQERAALREKYKDRQKYGVEKVRTLTPLYSEPLLLK
jgi:hypothetical protein